MAIRKTCKGMLWLLLALWSSNSLAGVSTENGVRKEKTTVASSGRKNVLPGTANQQDTRLSLNVDNAPVGQVLQALADSQQLNLVVLPGVQGNLSLNLKEVPWRQVLQIIADNLNLSWRQQDNILRVWPESWMQDQTALRDKAHEAQKLRAPLHNAIFDIRHADATELATALNSGSERLLSSRGSITVDKRTNRLLVRDTRQELDQLERWVAEMDVALGQVELVAHIVTMTRQSLQQLGVRWSLADSSSGSSSSGLNTLQLGKSTADASLLGFNVGRVSGRLLEVELAALEQRNLLDIIASPRLLVAHQQEASIKQGTEIPYQVSTGDSGTAVEFREAVLGMVVTPTIQHKGDIRLKLQVSQNMPGASLQQGDGEVLTIDKQEIETQVQVKSGETLVLGGIFQQKDNISRDQVPLLGDIPLLGALFRQESNEKEKRELIVFITPRLVGLTQDNAPGVFH